MEFSKCRRTKRNLGREGGTSARVYGTDSRVGVQVGRASTETAERAFGGKPSGATRRGLLSVFSNASHGQLTTSMCVGDSRVCHLFGVIVRCYSRKLTGLEPAADAYVAQ